uniref:Uncharacterized protein n=1 Tax=Anguilla anguilla TaxID=7936 RepID=A0A0E9TF20_ANGAN
MNSSPKTTVLNNRGKYKKTESLNIQTAFHSYENVFSHFSTVSLP